MYRNSEKWSNGKTRIDIYRNVLSEKALCLTANMYKGVPYGVVEDIYLTRETNHILDGYYLRRLTPVECERLQTVPDNYTSSVSNSQRYKMLGNRWTVDVIAHLFGALKEDDWINS